MKHLHLQPLPGLPNGGPAQMTGAGPGPRMMGPPPPSGGVGPPLLHNGGSFQDAFPLANGLHGYHNHQHHPHSHTLTTGTEY